jgi:5'-3' exonuclease
MGIKNFGAILKKSTTGVSTKSYGDFSGETWAIDASIFCYRFAHNAQSKRPNSHIDGFYQLFLRLLKFKIKPILILDGHSPQEKKHTVDLRIKQKQKTIDRADKLKQELSEIAGTDEVNTPQQLNKLLTHSESEVVTKANELIRVKKSIITFQAGMFDDIILLCELMNVPVMRAKGEADVLCSRLYKEGIVQAIMSEDSDILLYGGGRLIRKFGWTNEIELLELDKILQSLGITYQQFIDLAILCGTDYTTGTIPGLGPVDALCTIQNGLTIEQTLADCRYQSDNFCYQEARHLIQTSCQKEMYNEIKQFDFSRMQVSQLVALMSEKCNYRPITVQKHCNIIEDIFRPKPVQPVQQKFKITLKRY